jgi:hypothetical protein
MGFTDQVGAVGILKEVRLSFRSGNCIGMINSGSEFKFAVHNNLLGGELP